MTSSTIGICGVAELPEIVELVNACYRGTDGRVGWTSEVGLIDGDRLTLALLREELDRTPGVTIGVLREPPELLACVRVEDAPASAGVAACHIGMLAVRPSRQAAGLGRRMLHWAEGLGRSRGAQVARMTVVSARHSLIEWYERCGYCRTGRTAPFPYHDQRFGRPLLPGLEFVYLQKKLHG